MPSTRLQGGLAGVGEWDGGSQFENSYFTEIYRCSEAGSHFRLIDFVFHSTLGLGAIKKKKKKKDAVSPEAKWNRRKEWEGRISSANTYDS